ncbi:unnamed protein product [Oikopleura dioica]|uniref:Uncharacterized protein n=1 Tax=Oikopleura dioica TaxID=34765 RepID=E4Y996_OIKDI|nr:unnamed protein product [Oikopleura dioica]
MNRRHSRCRKYAQTVNISNHNFPNAHSDSTQSKIFLSYVGRLFQKKIKRDYEDFFHPFYLRLFSEYNCFYETTAAQDTTAAVDVQTTQIPIATTAEYDPFNSVFGFLTTTTDPPTTTLTTLTTLAPQTTTTKPTTVAGISGSDAAATPAVAEGSEEITQAVAAELITQNQNGEATAAETEKVTTTKTTTTTTTKTAISTTTTPSETTAESLETTTSGSQSLFQRTILFIPFALCLSSFLYLL